MPETGKKRANSTAQAARDCLPPANDASAMPPPSVDESGQSCGDDNVEGNFDLTTSRESSPPRTFSSDITGRNPTTGDAPALLEPPVTKKTLSELDVNKIVQNPKLRHDINFDPDLHFRPNLDGEKGRRKTEKQDGFYETMRTQLTYFLTNRDEFEIQFKDRDWCLPSTLRAIRGILETLVPIRDRSSVEESFDVDLLMQQFRMGVCDLPRLAEWLSQLLKCHCAPMRDTWVDEMVILISKGDRNGDVNSLVLGMRNLLGVLEAMKLDVANHQIRCLRPILIEDTVQFEQKFFMKKINMRRIDVASAHAWYSRATRTPHVGTQQSSQESLWNFMKALVNLTLLSKAGEPLPHTFLFDEERVVKLRSDIEDFVNTELCMHTFRRLDREGRLQAAGHIPFDDTAVISAPNSPYSRPISPADNGIPPLPELHDFKLKDLKMRDRGHFRMNPSGHQTWIPSIEDDAMSSTSHASSRSTASSSSSTPCTYPSTPLYLSASSVDTWTQVRSSLQAILASSNSPKRWSTLTPSLALQIVRSTTTPLTRLPSIETELSLHISNPQSRIYQEAERTILSQLLPEVQRLSNAYAPLTSMQIFDAATSPKTGMSNLQAVGMKEEIDEIATRIAHIGTLHWRVWAPLAYLVNPDTESEQGEPSHVRASSMP